MKLRSLSLVTALTLVGAAACGGGGSDDKSGKPVELTYWSWLNGADKLVEAFNAAHPGIKVKYEKIPSGVNGGYDKISNAAKAGNGPDVVNVEYTALPEFASQNQLEDLTDGLGGTVKSTFPESVQSLVTLGGRTWAMPRDIGPQLLYYRKDFFDKNHLAVPKTWDEFKDTAKKVKQVDGSVRLTSFFNDDIGYLAGLSWQNGATWFSTSGNAWKVNLADPASQKVATYWQELVHQDLAWAQVSYSDQWTKGIVSGKTVALVGASWNAGPLKLTAPDEKGKWAAAPIPTWDGKPAAGAVGGSVYSVLKGHGKGAKAKAEQEFMKWATTTPEAWKATLASGTSAALPADPQMVATAKASFDTSYYGGQDIYALSSDALKSLRPGWQWGPVYRTLALNFRDTMGKLSTGGNLTDSLTNGQTTAVTEIKNRGLSLAS